MLFYPIQVRAVRKATREATTLTLHIPNQLREVFQYQPGQHIVFKFQLNGQEVRRSYSLNSSPFADEALEVTVKRVAGGLVSNYINDHVKAGDTLHVMPPQGRFFAQIDPKAYKTYFLFAAGSGITPIISILKSVLSASPHSSVYLFYGNTDQKSIIFERTLKALEEHHSDRFHAVHTLTEPVTWSTWKSWNGRKGRIDAKAVEWFINAHPPVAQNIEYFICGPGTMNTTVRNTLQQLGIPKSMIHIEQFGAGADAAREKIVGVDQAELQVTLHGQRHTVHIAKGQTILEAVKKAGLDPPYSCESGICATCMAKISEGQAAMKVCMALDDSDIAQGYILTCQAVPMTERIHLAFE